MTPTPYPSDRRKARRAARIAGYCLVGVGLVGFVLGQLLIPQVADALGVDPPATGIAQELGFALLIAGTLLAAVGQERQRRGSRTGTETVRSYPVAGGIPDAGRMANQLSQLPDDVLRDFVRGLDREGELWDVKGGYEWALENAPTPEARAQIQRVLDVFPPGPGLRLPPGGIHFPRWGSAADDVATFANEVSQLPDESLRYWMRTAPQEVRAGLDWAWQHAPTSEARAQVQRVLDAFRPAGSPPA